MTTQSTDLKEAETDTSVDTETGASPGEAKPDTNRSRKLVNYSISLKALVGAALVVAMVAGLVTLGWLLHDARTDLDQKSSAAADQARAEQIATDYAVGAAQMDFRDLPTWRGRLTQGTTPELSDRLTKASSSMEQIIAPLQWYSTATPIAATAQAGPNGTYSVDCFVSVLTKNTQAPEGIQSTATYKLTIDSRDDWKITEISGIDSALEPTPEPR